MTLPPEVSLAFFPPSYAAGRTVVRPLTLAGAVRLYEIGADPCRRVPERLLRMAAKVLGGGASRDGGSPIRCKDLASAIGCALNDAFETFVNPGREDDGISLTPKGLGWPLEIAEFICSQYGWDFACAANLPVATAFALVAAARKRNGLPHSGMDYVQRQYARDLKAGKVKPVII